ncbi:MAG: hypothetical protein ACPLRH_08580, partial [Desulfotomaculales bacterium]
LAASVIFPVLAGWKKWPENVALMVFLPIYVAITVQCIGYVFSEMKASLSSVSKLKQEFNAVRLREFIPLVVQDIVSDVILKTSLYILQASAMWFLYKMIFFMVSISNS